MTTRYPGGFITKSPVAPTSSAASGMWTMDQATQNIKAQTWPGLASYWIGLLGSSGVNDNGNSITVDSGGNIYVLGTSNASGINAFQLAKYDTSGAIQWQRSLTGGVGATGASVATDSSGNIYTFGNSTPSGSNDFQIAKYNSSGAIQWQRRLYGNDDVGSSVAVDSSGNVYICGYSNNSGTYELQLAKYNTSGAIQWQRSLGTGGTETAGRGVAVDSSGNVYVGAYNIDGSGEWRFVVAKYDTSGTIQWQRGLTGPGVDIASSVAVDSSGNVYAFGRNSVTGSNAFQLAKYDTSGAIQWQRSLTPASGSSIGTSVATDSSGNVYVCGISSASGTNDFQIAKYNTSGVIQWQRSLASSGTDQANGIAVDSGGNVYVCGTSNGSGNNDFLIAKLPGDGSRTGTYTVGGVSFTYAATTLTDAASSLTGSTMSLTAATSSLTDAATSLTDTATTLTSTVVSI